MAATNRQSQRVSARLSSKPTDFGEQVEEVKENETADLNVFSQEGRNCLRDEM